VTTDINQLFTHVPTPPASQTPP